MGETTAIRLKEEDEEEDIPEINARPGRELKFEYAIEAVDSDEEEDEVCICGHKT
jgi:hypothetical protein